jgi:hypothetical protein
MNVNESTAQLLSNGEWHYDLLISDTSDCVVVHRDTSRLRSITLPVNGFSRAVVLHNDTTASSSSSSSSSSSITTSTGHMISPSLNYEWTYEFTLHESEVVYQQPVITSSLKYAPISSSSTSTKMIPCSIYMGNLRLNALSTVLFLPRVKVEPTLAGLKRAIVGLRQLNMQSTSGSFIASPSLWQFYLLH